MRSGPVNDLMCVSVMSDRRTQEVDQLRRYRRGRRWFTCRVHRRLARLGWSSASWLDSSVVAIESSTVGRGKSSSTRARKAGRRRSYARSAEVAAASSTSRRWWTTSSTLPRPHSSGARSARRSWCWSRRSKNTKNGTWVQLAGRGAADIPDPPPMDHRRLHALTWWDAKYDMQLHWHYSYAFSLGLITTLWRTGTSKLYTFCAFMNWTSTRFCEC